MFERWRIALLGGLRAERAGRVVARFRTEKTGGLLGRLALHAGRSLPRDELVEVIWPELDGPSGRAALSQAVWSLRKQLEPPDVPRGSVIAATRSGIALEAAAVTTDVAELRRALGDAASARDPERERHLERAAALYGGELLPGQYQDWALAERDRLREAFLGAVHAVVGNRLRAGEPASALDIARRATAADPLSEPARRDLARVLAALGERAAALRELDDLARRLEGDLGVAPAPATLALVRELRSPEPASASRPAAPPASARPAPAPRPATAPPPAPAPPPPAAPPPLPLELGRFFGREAELEVAREALTGDVRLLTITGPGGIGKTRFAREAAALCAAAFRGAVFLVPLAELAQPSLIPDAVAAALRAEPGPAGPLERAAAALGRHERALLLLDNLEHLLPAGAAVVRALLERVPRLACLVTSRRPLGLEGERELPLAPLATPAGALAPARLLELPSARLFVDRARAARPDFEVTEANAPALAELLRRLEGIPLALALVAERAPVLSPAQMLERLEGRLDLPSRRGDAPARQRTLRAAIAWSAGLLSPEQRRLLARLSVFRGGFTLDAIEGVCGGPSAAEDVAELRGCSLLLTVERAGEVRFRMLEAIRAFAAGELAAEEREPLRRRHAEHFAALAERAAGEIVKGDAPAWLERVAAEHENLRAALECCAGAPDLAGTALRLAAALGAFWEIRGHASEGRRHLAAALERSAGRTGLRAQALEHLGALAAQQGDAAAAREAVEEALAIRREIGDRAGVAEALRRLGSVARREGDPERTRRLLEEALAIRRALGDRPGQAVIANDLGLLASSRGDRAAARAGFAECLRIHRESGQRLEASIALYNLALLEEDDDLAAARRHAEEAALGFEAAGDAIRRAIVRCLLGGLLLAGGDAAGARAIHEENVTLLRSLGARPRLADELRALGRALIAARDLAAARERLLESEAILREASDAQGLGRTLGVLGDLALAEGRGGAARASFVEALSLAGKVEPRSAGTAALIEGLAAALALDRLSLERAATLVAGADALHAELGTQRSARDRERRERLVAELRASLGPAGFDAAAAEARALGLDGVLALAGTA